MNGFELIKTMPDQDNFALFTDFPKQLYPEKSPRFRLGHDPDLAYLEGCYVLKKEDQTVGRFAFYENLNLKWNGVKTACIGSYECVNDETISEYLIQSAKELTQQKGYSQLIGPMDGSTWNSHRFSTNNQHSNFFMEPYHHTYYNNQFSKAGFQIIAQYESNLVKQPSFDASKYGQQETTFLEMGAVVRPVNIHNLKTELAHIAAFCNEAFKDNFCFTPIQIDDFVEKYIRLKDLITPALFWLVEDQTGTLQAISFSIKDYNDPSGKQFIIKTLARKKQSSYKGIGSFLLDKTYKHALELGFETAIHAFMKTDNISTKISHDFAGKAYKNYCLYGIQL